MEVSDFYEEVEMDEEIETNYNNNWTCFKCNNDVIRLVIIDRRDGTFYFRRCSSCGNKTKVKQYNDKVEGIK